LSQESTVGVRWLLVLSICLLKFGGPAEFKHIRKGGSREEVHAVRNQNVSREATKQKMHDQTESREAAKMVRGCNARSK